MYIKLGTLNLQYYQDTGAWMIMAEILDSGMSFESPVLVRTTEELDIWFGRDFSDYNYMQEFLNMGVVLYLYRPISTNTSGGNDYIDLTQFTEDPEIWLRDVEIGWITNILNDPDIYKFDSIINGETRTLGYKLVNNRLTVTIADNTRKYCIEDLVRPELIDQIIKIYNNRPSFHVYNSESLWIYYESEILDEALLPQNINLTSSSLDNRDTLIITDDDDIPYTYLDYNSADEEFGIYKNSNIVDACPSLKQEYKSDIDMDDVSNGYQTLVIGMSGGSFNDGDYFVFPNPSRGIDASQWQLYYYGQISKIPDTVLQLFDSSRTNKVTSMSNLLSKLRGLGYTIVEESGYKYLMSNTILPFTSFYRSEKVSLKAETSITCKCLSKYCEPKIKFASKTIGKSSDFEDDSININIKKLEDNLYQATITRYDYSETFEGATKITTLGEELLDSIITKNSKLVKCYLDSTEIREGDYKLRGATIEETNSAMYKYSLEKMLSTEYSEPAYPDYFLIPDKYKYTSDIQSQDLYNLFLDYAKSINCQFLIENKSFSDLYTVIEVDEFPSTPEEGNYYKINDIYYDWTHQIVTDPTFYTILENGGDYVYNLMSDKENRLVYFYRSMTISLLDRPGYYVYLRGLLLNEYSVSVKDILYETPTKDAFLDYNIEEILETYKSNYLVCDNQTYYYKKYQNGSNYITTGWARFVLGKVYREFQKHSGEILGQQVLGKVRSNIIDLLYLIESEFSIISSIQITSFEPSENGESLSITIETYVNDLVDNNVSLDITVNYNNQ